MKWAFIDYENVSNLEKIDLSIYDKIIIFLGAKQPKLDFGTRKYDKLLNLVIIQMKAVQANNLDFHLSYYLGKYDAIAEKEVSFEIISNDNGYAPLISHVKSNGRLCKQVKIESISAVFKEFTQKLKAIPKEKRPKKLASLKNHIASHLRLQGNEVEINRALQSLVELGIVSLNEETLSYNS
jgi:hypothetical protein